MGEMGDCFGVDGELTLHCVVTSFRKSGYFRYLFGRGSMQRVSQWSAILVLLVASSSSNADILWNQAPNATLGALIDQQFSDFPTFSTYMVNDVTFGSNVTVNSVTTYFTNQNSGTWLGVSQGILNIFDGNGLVAGDDPTTGGDFGPGLIAVSFTDLGGGILAATASGLNINLAAGTYWFGLTPDAAFGTFAQEFHLDSGSTVGSLSQVRNPGAAFGFGTDWSASTVLSATYADGPLLIEGTSAIPEPSAAAGLLVLSLFGFVARRRR
jgi:hypothetical protein